MSNETKYLVQSFQQAGMNQILLNRITESEKVEQQKIIMVLNRIKSKNGSVQHFIKYLSLVLI